LSAARPHGPYRSTVPEQAGGTKVATRIRGLVLAPEWAGVPSRARHPSSAADLASFPGIESQGGAEPRTGSEAIWDV